MNSERLQMSTHMFLPLMYEEFLSFKRNFYYVHPAKEDKPNKEPQKATGGGGGLSDIMDKLCMSFPIINNLNCSTTFSA